MNIGQSLKMATKSIFSNVGRSILTMLGVIIGLAAVIILVSYAQGQNMAMQAYYDVGFDGIARPDHVPTMVGETAQEASYGLQGNLFAVGYIKGLMEAVQKTRA